MSRSALPLVSVIVPAYNHAQYVQQTLRSIIEQDYPRIELILIDDGSPDNTLEKVKEMQSICENRFENTDISTQENQGTTTTMNRLIEKAKGQYILPIASDDELLPGAISALVAKMENEPDAGLVVGRNLVMDGDGNPCYWDSDRNNIYIRKDAFYLDFTDFLEKTTLPTSHPKWGTYETLLLCNHIPNGYLIRKSILDQIPPFTRDAPLEDWWLMLQLVKHSKLMNIAKETFRYRWHATNTINQTEKMSQYARMTMEWEQNYTANLKDKTWHRIIWKTRLKKRIPKFLFQKKITTNGRTIIKICRIPVYISRCL